MISCIFQHFNKTLTEFGREKKKVVYQMDKLIVYDHDIESSSQNVSIIIIPTKCFKIVQNYRLSNVG